MKILFVSAEVSPFAKVGGLADVAGALPKELNRQDQDCRVVMPLYSMIEQDPRWQLSLSTTFEVEIGHNQRESCAVYEFFFEGVLYYFIGHEKFFKSASNSAGVYTPGIEQYLFFSEAVLQMTSALRWSPDVVHCNDWHTGFIPVLMRERFVDRFRSTASLYTIHNLAYQGEFGPEILDSLGLPRSLFVSDKLETYGGVNFLKAGCVYSDQVNTVSPRYASEIQTPEFGCRLEGLMLWLRQNGRLSGILNGIDLDLFNPETDRHLAHHYSVEDLQGKQAVKTALLQSLHLPPTHGPLIGAVTRLSTQKGLKLLAEVTPWLVGQGCQLVVQGLGDPEIADRFKALQQEHSENVRLIELFDEGVAQNIYGGSDIFAMPSAFEPCGLGQLIALRYGTIPVVRATGGLADTVLDEINGFTFAEPTCEALQDAFSRALTAYGDSARWRGLIDRAMNGDYGWAKSAQAYLKLYASATEARPTLSRVG